MKDKTLETCTEIIETYKKSLEKIGYVVLTKKQARIVYNFMNQQMFFDRYEKPLYRRIKKALGLCS